MVSQENAPHQTLSQENMEMCLSQTCTHQKQTGTEIVTLKCVKKGQIKLNAS